MNVIGEQWIDGAIFIKIAGVHLNGFVGCCMQLIISAHVTSDYIRNRVVIKVGDHDFVPPSPAAVFEIFTGRIPKFLITSSKQRPVTIHRQQRARCDHLR